MATLLNTRLTDQTLVLPSGTTAERPANPAPGSMRFNTTLGLAEVYDYGSWRDLANGAESSNVIGSGASTIMYLPLFGNTGANADITDQLSGTVGTLANTNTRNYTQGGYDGLYVSSGGQLNIRPPQLEYGPTSLNGRKYWTVEWWCWNFGTGSSSVATMLEMNQYPYGILYRGQGATVDHYWRNSPISWGNVTTGAWCHYALVGYGATIKVFNNGTQVSDVMNAVGTSQFADPYYQGSATGIRLGASNHNDGLSQYTNGVFRKFRVSLGARYAAAFTPADVYPIT